MPKNIELEEGEIAVTFYLAIGLVGCRREETVAYSEDITDEELDEDCKMWMQEQIEYGFKR